MFLLSFSDFYTFIIPILLVVHTYTYFFIINSSGHNKCKNLLVVNNIKVNNPQIFINFGIFICFLNQIYLYVLHGINSLSWFSHFNFNNFAIFLLYITPIFVLCEYHIYIFIFFRGFVRNTFLQTVIFKNLIQKKF